MKKSLALLITCLFAATVAADEWQPCKTFLKAVSYVESSHGKFVYGDEGRSLGEFQLSEAAWLDVNRWRKARRLKTYSYQDYVFHAYISRVYAGNYLTILHGELSRKLDRPPTHSELYAAYNMGLQMFARCDYKIERVNSVTREKCRQIGEIMRSENS